VSAREQTRDGQLDDLVVADNAMPDFGGDAGKPIAEQVNGLADGWRNHRFR
jgi:hypothetical protein